MGRRDRARCRVFAPGVGISRLLRSDGLGVQNVFCVGGPSDFSGCRARLSDFGVEMCKAPPIYSPQSNMETEIAERDWNLPRP